MLSRIVLLCAIAAALAGCGGSGPGEGAVVAAFYPLAYAAEQVGADDVVNLTPPGAEPHDLELTARDVARIRQARLVVYVGGGFQPALEAALGPAAARSLDVLDGLALVRDGDDGTADPHVWLDPLRFASVARRIAIELGERDAADALVARLETLDGELRAGLARCKRREVVTSHAAFGYLAERYGLRQVPLVGLTPEAEPGPREVEALVRAVRASGATTVFFETLAPRELAETVAREAGAATAVLDPLEGLGPDELAAGDDYFDVMRRNLAALRTALGCA